MRKYLLIIAIALLASCSGTKKVSETKKEVTKDTLREVIKIVKTDSTSLNKITNVDENEDISYEPADKSHPMYIEGVPYENVIIKKTKRNKFVETVNEVKLIKEKVDAVIEEGHKNMVESDKKLYKEYSTFSYVWVLLIIIILYIIYRVHKFSRINF
jgi:hypothetical protein